MLVPSSFRYSHEKNMQLLHIRGIGFEEIIRAISEGNLLATKKHPNDIKYPNQRIMFVRILDEVYSVPCVMESPTQAFLKTVFPSRKARKKLIAQTRLASFLQNV